MKTGSKKRKDLTLREKRQAVFDRFGKLCREYGTVRFCTVDMYEGSEALLLFSPPLLVEGDIATIPTYILDPQLWRLAVEAFGSVKVAVAAFGGQNGQLSNYGK